MSGRIGNCTFKTGCNQQINACARLPRDCRSCIFGTVVDECNQPVVDAVVQLLEVKDKCSYPEPVAFTFTDNNGQFLFGPLCPNTTYMLKIYYDNTQIVCKALKVACHNGSCLSGKECSPCQS